MAEKKILLCQRGWYFKKEKTFLYFKEILSNYIIIFH